MAATRLIALHKNKGKSVATCLKSRTDYAQNPEKTKQGELVSSYECSPLTVDEEFKQKIKDVCTYCQIRYGFDYYVQPDKNAGQYVKRGHFDDESECA